MTLRALAVAAVAAAVGLGFARAAADPPPRPAAPAGSRPSIHSLAARLRAGQSARLLSLRRIGRFTVACGSDRRSRVTFRAAHLLPTSDVVVSPGRLTAATLQPDGTVTRPAAAIVAETWQIAPFASAGVRVTTVHVTAQPAPGGCAAAAMAVIGPDQGPTRTGEG